MRLHLSYTDVLLNADGLPLSDIIPSSPIPIIVPQELLEWLDQRGCQEHNPVVAQCGLCLLREELKGKP